MARSGERSRQEERDSFVSVRSRAARSRLKSSAVNLSLIHIYIKKAIAAAEKAGTEYVFVEAALLILSLIHI